MHRFLAALLFVSLFVSSASALEIKDVPPELRPGKEERFLVSSDRAGEADVYLIDENGAECRIIKGIALSEGVSRVLWDGTGVSAGRYGLCVRMGSEQAQTELLVGAPSPSATYLNLGQVQDGVWQGAVFCSDAGELLVELEYGGVWETMQRQPVDVGRNMIVCPLSVEGDSVPDGIYALRISLKDETGFRGTSQQISVGVNMTVPKTNEELFASDDPLESTQESPVQLLFSAAEPAEETLTQKQNSVASHQTIASRLTTAEDETCYWTMPLGDLTQEQTIWEILMQPVVVIDQSGRTAKETYRLRATPDKSLDASNIVGEVTYKSQGVHVVENREDGWTLVEAYNTSYGDTYRKNGRRGYGKTGELIQGYVETSALKTVTPRDDYALVIDKFTQKMYVFSGGKSIGTLLVSTGKNTSTQPWNETPAGEFLIASRTGGFYSGNLFCDMGLLLNNGCLIHEVPCVINEETGDKNYGYTEPYLGQKASHGCIRVQRALNDQGQNMRWLWNNLKVNTKVIIWEDSTRYTEYPLSTFPLYYNPQGGQYFHSKQNCSSVNKRYLPLSEFTYGELEQEPYLSLKPCKTCNPPARPETIREKNRANGYDE